MKQKIADRPNWARIIQKRYFQEYIQDDLFEGYISFLFLDQVRAPVNVRYGIRDVCIVDHKYSWLMFFPDNKQYSLTVMIDSNNEIMQWYFDIVKTIQLTDEGVPVIVDLYLDLVVLPNGEHYILDEDELITALEEGEINKNDYKLAIETLENLRLSIEQGENRLINNTERYIELLKRYQ
jgi:predicted RNA-binding protein associated with RNAse of E/G family